MHESPAERQARHGAIWAAVRTRRESDRERRTFWTAVPHAIATARLEVEDSPLAVLPGPDGPVVIHLGEAVAVDLRYPSPLISWLRAS